MKNDLKEITANNVIWVEHWINEVLKSDNEASSAFGEPYDCYRWICEINLPLINKKVQAISEKEVNAVLRANNKAAKLINEYIKEHPELNIKNNFKRKGYVISYDEDGRIKSVGLSKESRRKMGAKYEETMTKTLAVVQNAIKKINKLTGATDNLFLQVINQGHFGDLSVKDTLNVAVDKIQKTYKIPQLRTALDDDTNSIISIGFTGPHTDEDDENPGIA